MAASAVDLFPCPSSATLRESFVGKTLQQVAAPAAVLDRSIVERNCQQMLKSCEALKVGFRPHTKTHKTIEVTKLQIGDTIDTVKIVVSTVSEIEHLTEHLLSCREKGQKVNVLYGVPLPPSQVHRLGQLGVILGSGSISVMIDHPSQLQGAHAFKDIAGFPIRIFVKIDTGYHRAGLSLDKADLQQILEGIFVFEASGTMELAGFYSHAGHSYGGDTESAAMKLLVQELEGLEKAATLATASRKPTKNTGSKPQYILSVGATPTATSIQNLLTEPYQGRSKPMQEQIVNLKSVMQRASSLYSIEFHAGVYPFLDMQQLATQASPSAVSKNSFGQPSRISTADIALTILAEVASVYDTRKSPEALIAAGSLALGRDPCKSYSGWGIVSGWNMNLKPVEGRDGERKSGWQVGRIAQEHGILTKDVNSCREASRLNVGQKVRVWPNHACVAGAMYGWYLVVDSSLPEDRRDEIVDVWVRWRGW